jgi:hypothetical protein
MGIMTQSSLGKIAGAQTLLLLALCFGSSAAAQDERYPHAVHVYVALADNLHQGIVPVPSKLGNGQDPARNLYWGAAFGVKTYFKKSPEWKLLTCGPGHKPIVLERCIFEHDDRVAYLVADAYDGAHIREAVTDFLTATAGGNQETITFGQSGWQLNLAAGGAADLVAYVGHDAFMDFQIPPIAGSKGNKQRRAIVLACASKSFFAPYIRPTGADPLLWTTGLMAPEAYTLEAALDGWIAGEDDEAIRRRAAEAYDKYQKCGSRGALRLFATGW